MKNVFAIVSERQREGKLYLCIDTTRAMLRGIEWKDLGDFGKRKFENLIFLERMHTGRDKIRFVYA